LQRKKFPAARNFSATDALQRKNGNFKNGFLHFFPFLTLQRETLQRKNGSLGMVSQGEKKVMMRYINYGIIIINNNKVECCETYILLFEILTENNV
jgi:hypothetical protein